MKEHSAVQTHLYFIFNSFYVVKKDNEFWTERLEKEYDKFPKEFVATGVEFFSGVGIE